MRAVVAVGVADTVRVSESYWPGYSHRYGYGRLGLGLGRYSVTVTDTATVLDTCFGRRVWPHHDGDEYSQGCIYRVIFTVANT